MLECRGKEPLSHAIQRGAAIATMPLKKESKLRGEN